MNQPLEVVGAAIVRDERVLAARKGSGPLEGLWEFPGGKVEAGESASDALVREVMEELACAVRPGRPIATTEHHYPQVSIRLTTLLCTLLEGEPTPSEHSELRWVNREELESLAWAPADAEAAAAVGEIL